MGPRVGEHGSSCSKSEQGMAAGLDYVSLHVRCNHTTRLARSTCTRYVCLMLLSLLFVWQMYRRTEAAVAATTASKIACSPGVFCVECEGLAATVAAVMAAAENADLN
jgi:hypothetical protein